jgi:hypothetical protein
MHRSRRLSALLIFLIPIGRCPWQPPGQYPGFRIQVGGGGLLTLNIALRPKTSLREICGRGEHAQTRACEGPGSFPRRRAGWQRSGRRAWQRQGNLGRAATITATRAACPASTQQPGCGQAARLTQRTATEGEATVTMEVPKRHATRTSL